jgi:AcrR family transcriptional regulator
MSEAGEATRKALLDAAEELLILKGAAGITTRKVADKAGVHQALVHYHFGTIEQLLLAVLERVSVSVKERARQTYSANESSRAAWFDEMEAKTTSDFDRGWGKVWLENLTLAANRPAIRKQYVKVSTTVRKLHEDHMRDLFEHWSVDTEEFPPAGMVTLVDAITSKLILDRLVGMRAGHDELIQILHRLWELLEETGSRRALSGTA